MNHGLRTALLSRFVRARRNEDGTSAIEFAILATPFFMLTFAIFEIGLVYFANFSLDNAVDKSARMIRTGQMQSAGLDAAGFKSAVCANLSGVLSCGDQVKFDVKSFPNFGAVTVTPPIDEDGKVKEDFGYSPGNASEVVVVRVFYEWDLIGKFPNFGIAGFGLGNLANGNRLIQSTAVFRNEPF